MIKKGIAAVIATMAIIAFTSLSVVVLHRSVSESNFAKKYSRSTRAFWLGEAGVEDARKQLKLDWYDRTSSSGSLYGGTYTFTIDANDSGGNPLANNQLRITSDGVANEMSRTIEAIVEDVPFDNFQYAILGGVLVEIKPGATIHGDVYVNGDVEIQAGASVVKIDDSIVPADPNAYEANVYYTGAVRGMGGTVEGSLIPTTEIYNPPTFDWNEIRNDADFILPSGTKLSGNIADGVYYITGNVELQNVTLDHGAIIAEAGIEVNGNCTLSDPEAGFPMLANQSGTIEIVDSVDVTGLVYSDGSGVELKTGSTMTVYGGIIAADSGVEIKTDLGNLHVYHKEQYLLRLPDSTLAITRWKENNNPYKLTP